MKDIILNLFRLIIELIIFYWFLNFNLVHYDVSTLTVIPAQIAFLFLFHCMFFNCWFIVIKILRLLDIFIMDSPYYIFTFLICCIFTLINFFMAKPKFEQLEHFWYLYTNFTEAISETGHSLEETVTIGILSAGIIAFLMIFDRDKMLTIRYLFWCSLDLVKE